jgi:hypothetical protein
MALLISLALVGALTTPLHKQSADDRELQHYRLTAAVLTQVEAVAKAYEASLAKDPKAKKRADAQRELDELDKKETLTPAEQKRAHELQSIVDDEPADLGIDGGTLSQITAQLTKMPTMAAALKSAGMPAREMAKFVVTIVNAGMIGAMGQAPPPGAAGENVKFVMANQSAIERINKLLGAK